MPTDFWTVTSSVATAAGALATALAAVSARKAAMISRQAVMDAQSERRQDRIYASRAIASNIKTSLVVSSRPDNWSSNDKYGRLVGDHFLEVKVENASDCTLTGVVAVNAEQIGPFEFAPGDGGSVYCSLQPGERETLPLACPSKLVTFTIDGQEVRSIDGNRGKDAYIWPADDANRGVLSRYILYFTEQRYGFSWELWPDRTLHQVPDE